MLFTTTTTSNSKLVLLYEVLGPFPSFTSLCSFEKLK